MSKKDRIGHQINFLRTAIFVMIGGFFSIAVYLLKNLENAKSLVLEYVIGIPFSILLILLIIGCWSGMNKHYAELDEMDNEE